MSAAATVPGAPGCLDRPATAPPLGERHGSRDLARRLLGCLGRLEGLERDGGHGAPSLAPLNVAFAGHAGTWEWTGGPMPLIVKYAGRGDREARESLRREAAVLAAFAATGVVAPLACVLPGERPGEVAGFAYERLPAERGVACDRPAAVAAFAEAIAALHARTWGLPQPPLGLDVPVALGGHPLWIGGAAILRQMCAAIDREDHDERGGCDERDDRSERNERHEINERGKRNERSGFSPRNHCSQGSPCRPDRPLARRGLAALDLLEGRREEIAACFPSEELVLIHGDIDENNLLFHREALAWRCRLIDFGEVVVGAPQYDLARFTVSAKLPPEGEELLLSLYARWIEERTPPGRRCERLGARFRAGYEWQKALALFDIRIASYVIYAVHGLDPGPREWVLERMDGALSGLRAALAAGRGPG